MAPSVSIVLFGRDEHLLESRRLVLDSAGYHAARATQLSQIEHLLAANPVRLLILCHSLPPTMAQQAITAAAAQRHPVKCLALVTTDIQPDLDRPVALMSAREGPARLLETVARLLGPASPR